METTNNVIEVEEMTEVAEPIVNDIVEANSSNGNGAVIGFAIGAGLTIGATLLTKYVLKPIAKKVMVKIAEKKQKNNIDNGAATVVNVSEDNVVPVEDDDLGENIE